MGVNLSFSPRKIFKNHFFREYFFPSKKVSKVKFYNRLNFNGIQIQFIPKDEKERGRVKERERKKEAYKNPIHFQCVTMA